MSDECKFIDQFIDRSINYFNSLAMFSKNMITTESEQQMIDDALKIIERKLKKCMDCNNMDQLDKYVKIDKLIEDDKDG
jgi:hypothetical protein